ncbi:glycosyltransferase family 39 protein [Actinomadura scrupuli]|uniref:glycosyltransferase family 39 protein n=1 Tax=Actinomadura scrupuli TaxID=559629 RepID=UPI003D992368
MLTDRERLPLDDRPDSLPGRPRAWRDPGLLIPAGLALVWLAVLVAHLRFPYPSDQLNYLRAAARFPDPLVPATETHQVTRFGLLIPVRLVMTVFGYSQTSYYVVPVLGTLVLLIGTYALGSLLFSRWVGAAGGLVVVAATPVFVDSTDLLPDVLATALFTAALAVALAIRRERLPAGRWTLIALGLLLGWSYLVREFIVFVWPLIPVLLYRRVGWSGLAWLAAPIALLGLGETLLCWGLYGDPLARVKAVTGHAQGYSPPRIAGTFRDKPRSVYLLRLPSTLHRFPEGRWLQLLLGLTLLGGLVRPRRFALLVAWCALLWVPLSLLGGVLDPAKPSLRLQLIRYWFPVFPAFVLGGLGLVWLAGRFLAGRMPQERSGALRAAAAVLPVAALLAVSAATAGTAARGWWASPATRVGGGTQLEAFRTWMSRHDDGAQTIWAERHTVLDLGIYRNGPFGGTSWHQRLKVARAGGEQPVPGDLVLFFDTEQGQVCGHCRTGAREVWSTPPRPLPGWRQVYATRDGVVRVYSAG